MVIKNASCQIRKHKWQRMGPIHYGGVFFYQLWVCTDCGKVMELS